MVELSSTPRSDPELGGSPPSPNDAYAERAFRDGVPAGAVALRCRNRGLSRDLASQMAEEAAAEAITRSLRRGFECEEHFRAWVTRVALNYATDLLRRSSRSASLPADDLPALARPPALESRALAVALGQLSELQRDLVEMTYTERLTLDRIADRILGPGCGSANARRLRVKRWRDAALIALRDFLGASDV